MDIERVNEFTVKFFITYNDIEERGFDREEIWYNRERGEELFWDLMDEANHIEQFPMEGPLWIQVQALESGLEVVVTRAHLTHDNDRLEITSGDMRSIEISVDEEKIESLLERHFKDKDDKIIESFTDEYDSSEAQFLIVFQDFEDVISLSHALNPDHLFTNELYVFEGRYYLFLIFNEGISANVQDDLLSRILEFGHETEVTIHRICEYGKVIFAEEALQNVRKMFSKR